MRRQLLPAGVILPLLQIQFLIPKVHRSVNLSVSSSEMSGHIQERNHLIAPNEHHIPAHASNTLIINEQTHWS